MNSALRKIPLSEAFWFQEGPGVRKWQFRHRGIKLLNVGNITPDGEIDLNKTDRFLSEDEALGKYAHFLADDGDLVMASSGISFQDDGLLKTKAAFVRENHLPLCMNTSTIRFKPRSQDFSLFYLKHWLQSNEFRDQISRQVTGIAQLNFGPSHLKAMSISIPSPDEQRRIAAILDKADAIRRKREQSLTMADDFLRSAFLEMFGDPEENEREWPLSPLGDLGDVQGGLQVTSKRVSMGMTLPYLRVANVYRDRLNLDEIKDINLSEAEFKRVRLEAGDILIVEGHGNPDEIGRAAIWDGSIEPCVHQNHLIRFRADRKRALPDFISRFLNSDGGRRQLISAGRTTSGLNTISTRKVKEVSVPLPPLALQDQFAHFVRKQMTLKNRLLAQRIMSNNLFAALSQRAFSGEL